MATVVNKSTFEIIQSANTPDYDPAFWLINPPSLDFMVANVPIRYWKVSLDGLDLEEMTPAEKLAVDTDPDNLAVAKASLLGSLRSDAQGFLDERYDNIKRDTLIGMHTLSVVSRQKARRDYVASFLLWLESLNEYIEGVVDSIEAAVDIPAVLAITYDLSPFDASDPKVDVIEASRRKAVAY